MPWTAQGICNSNWWPASSLRSRAALRWLSALLAATFLLCVAWTYHHADASNVLSSSSSSSSSSSTPQRPLTPWIDTPSAYPSGGDTTTTTAPPPPQLPPQLGQAIARFLSRPALSHEQAVGWNEEGCPRAQLEVQVNQDQLRDMREAWTAVTAAGVREMREAAVAYLVARAEAGDVLVTGGGGPGGHAEEMETGSRGVVIAAGNRRTVERAVVLVRELRRLGWAGGVEVWHFDGELEEEEDRKGLEAEGVVIRMVSQDKAPGQWKNFELKAEAILRSSFDEVLFLDSDNFPLADITPLFDAPLFRDPQGGQAIFWPDLNRDHPDNAIHRVLGIPCHNAWQLDSGQLLISKSGNGGLNLAALHLATYMATKGGYWFSGGDKDTFRYAFLALGIPYTPAPRWLALLGATITPRSGGGDSKKQPLYCGAAMLQYGITPESPTQQQHPAPLFVHANLLKHMAGVRKGDAFPQMRRLALDQDHVRATERGGPLDHVVGGAREVPGRGLCSDLWVFGEGHTAVVETVDTVEAFGGLMADFEERYFASGVRAGGWK